MVNSGIFGVHTPTLIAELGANDKLKTSIGLLKTAAEAHPFRGGSMAKFEKALGELYEGWADPRSIDFLVMTSVKYSPFSQTSLPSSQKSWVGLIPGPGLFMPQ